MKTFEKTCIFILHLIVYVTFFCIIVSGTVISCLGLLYSIVSFKQDFATSLFIFWICLIFLCIHIIALLNFPKELVEDLRDYL